MAGALKTLPRLLLAVALGAATGLVHAEAALSDPTRPPAAMEPPAPGPAAAAAAGSGLQTVILREGHKPVAVIDGVAVELGGKVGDATLVKVNESEAVLQGPRGREVLRLTPAAEKMPILKRSPATDSGRAAKRRKAKHKDHE